MFGHTNPLQILTYFLILLPSLASAQPSRPGNSLAATISHPQVVVKTHQSQDSVPIQLVESGHHDQHRRSQEGQEMEDLSSSPRPARPGRVVRPEGSSPQQEGVRPEGEAQRLLRASSASPDAPLSAPSLKGQAVTPPSSHSLPGPPSRRLNTSLLKESLTRRHCATLEHLDPANMTSVQKGIAKLCCKYFASVCLVGGGAVSEYHKAAAPIRIGEMSTGISDTWDLHNAVMPRGDQREEGMHAMHSLENVLRRRRVEDLRERGSPLATPRAGPSNQAEIGPAEDEAGWTLLDSPTTPPRKNPKMPKMPKTPKTLKPLAFACPALASPARSRCAALRHLNPAGWTREQKGVAKCCCKYFVSFCMISAGAVYNEPVVTVPLVLGGVAAGIGGMGDLRQATRTSWRPRRRVDAPNAMHPLENVLRRRNRDGLRRRGEQVHKRATPPSTPRAGTTSQAESAPAEAEGSEPVPSAHAASNVPHAVLLRTSSLPSLQRPPRVLSRPQPPSGSPRRQPLTSPTPGTASGSRTVTPPARGVPITTPAPPHLQRLPPTRRTCAALLREIDPRHMTLEACKFASSCCLYGSGLCIIGAAAVTPLPYVRWPLVGSAIAMGGAGALQFYDGLQLGRLRREREAQQLRTAQTRAAQARQAPRREIPMRTFELPVRRRSLAGWGKRGLGERASPPGSPRAGLSSHAEDVPAEESRRLLSGPDGSPHPPPGPATPP